VADLSENHIAEVPDPRLAGNHVLVIEDDPMLAFAFEEAIVMAGCSVGIASNVSAALSVLHGKQIDAAILDFSLGNKDSGRVAEALVNHGIPFILVTGHDLESLKPPYSGHRALQKPIRIETLWSELADLLLKR